jgi:hypothetical protein
MEGVEGVEKKEAITARQGTDLEGVEGVEAITARKG